MTTPRLHSAAILFIIACLVHLSSGTSQGFQFRFLHATPGLEEVSVLVNDLERIATSVTYGGLSDFVQVTPPAAELCALDKSWCKFKFAVGCGNPSTLSPYTGLIIKEINATINEYHTIALIGMAGLQKVEATTWLDLKKISTDVQSIAPAFLNTSSAFFKVVHMAVGGPPIDIAVNGVVLVKNLSLYEQSSFTITAGTFKIDIVQSQSGNLVRSFPFTVNPMSYHSMFGIGVSESVFPLDAVFSEDFSYAGVRIVSLNPFPHQSLTLNFVNPLKFNWTTPLLYNGTATDYLLIPFFKFSSNLHTVLITDGASVLGSAQLQAVKGATHSLFVLLNATKNSFAMAVADTLTIPPFLQSRIRVVSASPDTGLFSAQVTIMNPLTNQTATLGFTDVTYGQIGNYTNFGVYSNGTISATVTGNGKSYTTSFSVVEQAVYTLVVKAANNTHGFSMTLLTDEEVSAVSMGAARFLNAIVGAPELNVLLNKLPTFTKIMFGKFTPYVPLRSGFYNTSDIAGFMPFGNFFVPGTVNATLVAAGLWGINSTGFPLNWFEMLNNNIIPKHLSKFRLVNLVPSTIGAQLYVNNQLIFSNQVYGPYNGYSMIPSANYSVNIIFHNKTISFAHTFKPDILSTFCLVGPETAPQSVVIIDEVDDGEDNNNDDDEGQSSDDLGTPVIITIIVIGSLGGVFALGLVIFIIQKRRQNPYFDNAD